MARRCVTRQGQPIELKALDFDLLRFLVESAPNVVNADVLAEKVWGRHFVSPENVAQRVMLLRQSLADDANGLATSRRCVTRATGSIPVVEQAAGGTSANHAAAPLADPGHRRRLCSSRSASSRPGPTGSPVGRTAAAIAQLSIAVLPFENVSPDPDDAYFATGMQDRDRGAS